MTRTPLKRLLSALLSQGEQGRSIRAGRLANETAIRNLRSVLARNKAKTFSHVQAQVRASSINGWYTVTIRPWGKGWKWTCTCQDASKGAGPCKHTLAVAMLSMAKIEEKEQALAREAAMKADAERLEKAAAEAQAALALPGDEGSWLLTLSWPYISPALSSDDLWQAWMDNHNFEPYPTA